MGLDIKEFRIEKGGNPEKIKESQRRRFANVELVDEVIVLDQEWRKALFNYESSRKDLGITHRAISSRKKKDPKDSCEDLIKQKNDIERQISEYEADSTLKRDKLDNVLKKIGNIVHDSVLVDKNLENSQVLKTWGEKREIIIDHTPGASDHYQILKMIDGIDQMRGILVSGNRGYFLKNYGAILVQALCTFSQQFLQKKGYCPLYTPFFMKKDIMELTCQLSECQGQLYQVDSSSVKYEEEQKALKEKKEKYLIPSSEQPISAFHAHEWIDVKDLPFRYAGLSTCFRKESGIAGIETQGVFRVHQFEMVEQFVICRPEDSWNELEKMIQISEQFIQALGLPYRLTNIASGALNIAAAKKYVLEGWFPGEGMYKKIVSCQNTTDYQSRILDITTSNISDKKNERYDRFFVHMLNGTLCAAQRMLTCILENYQEQDGVRVPAALVPFVGVDFISYRKQNLNNKQKE